MSQYPRQNRGNYGPGPPRGYGNNNNNNGYPGLGGPAVGPQHFNGGGRGGPPQQYGQYNRGPPNNYGQQQYGQQQGGGYGQQQHQQMQPQHYSQQQRVPPPPLVPSEVAPLVPSATMAPAPLAAPVAQAQAQPVVPVTMRIGNVIWTEFKDAVGKTYYSNGVKSTYEHPSVFAAEEAAKGKKRRREDEIKQSVEEMKKEMEAKYKTKEEKVKAFKDMLEEMGVSSSVNFAAAQKMCEFEARWYACKTQGERKQAFAEYSTQSGKREQERAKREAREKKVNWLGMLKEHKELNGRSSYADWQSRLSKDQRFNILEVNERERVFYEYVDELDKIAERAERLKLEQTQKDFTSYLETLPMIDRQSTWEGTLGFLMKIKDERASLLLPFESPTDREFSHTQFRKHIGKLQAEFERQNRDKEEVEREKMQHVLQEMFSKGDIGLHTRWRQFLDTAEGKKKVRPVMQQGEAVAKNVFEEFMDTRLLKYQRVKNDLVDWIVMKKSVNGAEAVLFVKGLGEYEDFEKLFEDDARAKGEFCNKDFCIAKIFYEDCQTAEEVKDSLSPVPNRKRREVEGGGGESDDSEEEGECSEGEVEED
ncbi:hypothetical protein TL16_g00684 [Triparma laevis f. inornata]|uniref:FF domain-containing protein n=1 Tax=Triparma laevis f. inornata TaxID=1714386 RepID=A0A9W6ZD82_9STRA|nr:hypothetical protein TL16_g00684 [Triparma laevis f. inornata]